MSAMTQIREAEAEGWRVRLDLTGQVLQLDVPEFLYGTGGDGSLEPTLTREPGQIVSAAMLVQKAKQFDDGLYAAVELAAQRGAGTFSGKAALLTALPALLAADPEGPNAEAASLVLTACQAGGLAVECPAGLAALVRAFDGAFHGDAGRSKPIGV
jgi:hypothetical protein